MKKSKKKAVSKTRLYFDKKKEKEKKERANEKRKKTINTKKKNEFIDELYRKYF